MSEEISAGMGSAPDSASTNVGEAASAGSAGEQTGQPADPNVSAASENQIDAGWSLEEQPVEQALPDDDADIEELVKDPALDPTRTPGLVTALQTARRLAKESKRESAELKQQLTQLEQFGGMEGVNQTMTLVNDLLTNPQQGIGNFLNSLYSQAYPSYEHLVNSVITANADYAIEQLQQAGKLPADFQRRAGSIDPAIMATIPEHLRQIAKSLPSDVLESLFDQPEDIRNYNLERELKLSQLDANQRQAEQRTWREQSQAAQTQGQESAQKLAGQFESAHFTELAKWKPLGPDDESSNQIVYKMAWQGALDALLSDPKFGQMHTDAYSLLTNAPSRRLRNEGLAADQDERKGRQLAAQLNTRLGQILRDRVKLLDSVFRDARAYRESQRSQIPQRTEISGMSGSAGTNGAPPTLVNGKTNPKWLDWMISGLPGARS